VAPRSTTDLLILMIAGTICLMVLVTGIGIVVIELVDSDSDTTAAADSIAAVISTLIGLLAGFLAGRTDRLRRRNGERDVAD
jgi:hypothetical protein